MEGKKVTKVENCIALLIMWEGRVSFIDQNSFQIL
jgi:hypothetical protein